MQKQPTRLLEKKKPTDLQTDEVEENSLRTAVMEDILKEIEVSPPVEVEGAAEPVVCKVEQIYFDYVANKSVRLRNEILKKNAPLVTYIVSRYYGSQKEHRALREDLIQEGMIGLISAIDGYKPELNFRFSTYASWWIRQAVNHYLMNIEPTIHVPMHVRTANNKLRRKLAEENLVFKDFIVDYKNSEYTEKMINSINCAIRTKRMISFDEPVRGRGAEGGEKQTLKDVYEDDRRDSPLEGMFDSSAVVGIVRKSLAKLTARERNILLLRFDVISEVDTTAAKEQETATKGDSK